MKYLVKTTLSVFVVSLLIISCLSIVGTGVTIVQETIELGDFNPNATQGETVNAGIVAVDEGIPWTASCTQALLHIEHYLNTVLYPESYFEHGWSDSREEHSAYNAKTESGLDHDVSNHHQYVTCYYWVQANEQGWYEWEQPKMYNDFDVGTWHFTIKAWYNSQVDTDAGLIVITYKQGPGVFDPDKEWVGIFNLDDMDIVIPPVRPGELPVVTPITSLPEHLLVTGINAWMQQNPSLAIDCINDCIQNLPDDAFKKNPDQRKNALNNKLNSVKEKIVDGNIKGAIKKLSNDIVGKMDGSVVVDSDGSYGNPKNDWIIDPEVQKALCDSIISFIYTIQTPDYAGIIAEHLDYLGS